MAFEEQLHTDGWRTYSDWIDNLRNNSDIISHYDENQTFRDQLKACTSNRARFELIWNSPELRQEVEKQCLTDSTRYSNRCTKQPSAKSGEESKKMREQGNQFFKSNQYVDALKKYTQAVKFAPYPTATCPDDFLALALANRSAALYSLCKYRLCLSDIDMALKYGYPEANKFKLLIRKVKCLHILSVWSNDIEEIKEYLRNLVKQPTTKDYIKNEVNIMFEFIEHDLPDDIERNESDAEDENIVKISNASKTLTQAADCVEMSFDPEKGRYLLISKDVSYGRLLIAEDPFVCNLAPCMRGRQCYHCFERLHECGLSCESCVRVLYCSTECLNANKTIHKFECNKFLDFQEHLGVTYLVAHIMFKMEFDPKSIPIQSKKTIEEKSLEEIINIPSSNWPDFVYKNDYAAVLSLMDHAEDYDYDALMGFTLTAAYLITLFRKYVATNDGDFLVSTESQLVMGAIVLRHLLQLQTNVIAILSQRPDDLIMRGWQLEEARPERPVGVGIYPTVSLLNHSCEPNIMSIYHRNKFIVRAAKSLDCGTEINYCYGPHFNRTSKKDRQKRLLDQYFFTCTCDCCANDKENLARALVCYKCEGEVIYNDDLTSKCLGCGNAELNVQDHLKNIKSLEKKLKDLETSAGDMKTKLEAYDKLESQLKKLVNWRNPVFAVIKKQKTTSAEDNEDFDMAKKCCLEEQELCEKLFGKDSYESIMSKLKFVHIEWQRLYYKAEESDTGERKREALDGLRALLTTASAVRGKLKDLLNLTNIQGAESTFHTEFSFLSQTTANINKYLTSLELNDQPSIDT